jgi:phospholipase C
MRRYVYLCVAGAAVAALAGAASPPLSTAASPRFTTAASPPVRHVVIIYLENHTFDNILGFWCDAHRARCPDGGMPATVKLSNGAVVTPTVDPDTIPNVDHTGHAQVVAMDNGKMNGWDRIPPLRIQTGCGAQFSYVCVSGYKPSEEPNFARLARKFAISDMTFSESDSPSWEGHIYAVAASTDGFWGTIPVPLHPHTGNPGWGCDSNKITTWFSPGGRKLKEPSCVPDFKLGLPHGGAFEPTKVKYIPTIMDRLDAAGLTWRIYGATKGEGGYGNWDICPTFAQCLYTKQDKSLVTSDDFPADVKDGHLPNFSVITPGGDTFKDSCHNKLSMTVCDNWVGQLVREVENSSYWKSTAIFITFDDFGGFYDQVYPGKDSNPDGTQQGPRTPLIIVSPYVKPHYTDTTHTTFEGILAYTEHIFGLRPLGKNDAQAYDFHNAFDYKQAPLAPVRMVHRPLPPSAKRIRITPDLLDDPS